LSLNNFIDFSVILLKSAATAGWNPQEKRQVDFDNLPGANKVTMLKVAESIRQKYIKNSF